MIRIAKCESHMRQFGADGQALRGEVNPKDRGLFQINEDYHLAEARKAGMDILTTDGNIAFARALYERNGTRDWISSEHCWRT